VDVSQHGTGQAYDRAFVREDAHHPAAALELLVQPF
jgi:hypothetical protein